MTGFDLRDDPWILARDTHGEVREYSLSGLFRSAHELEAIVGDVPTQVFATTRMLLAVLYASVEHTPGTDVTDAWERLWRAPTLPIEQIERYLRDPKRASRFDLFDETQPFFQTAGLHTLKNDVAGLERLVADVPNGEQFFTTRRARGITSIPFGEAARWLVHIHAFDVSGIKSGAVGDIRVKGGRGYPLGSGWAGELGGLLVQGTTIRQTLLLNLVLGDHTGYLPVGIPAWDRAPLGPGVETDATHPDGREPTGLADLYTWQSRRVRLVRDDDEQAVVGVVLAYGDPLRPHNRHGLEQMTSWRYSEPQSKKAKRTVYMPSTHDPDRLMWQGLGTLLPLGEAGPTAAARKRLPAGVISWIAQLAYDDVVPSDARFDVRSTGMSYGTHSSVIDEIIDDGLSIRPLLLIDAGAELATAAVDAVTQTDDAVKALTALAADLEVAAGGEPDGARDRARSESYFELDREFRLWLAALGTPGHIDRDVVHCEWHVVAARQLTALADAYLADAADAAWIGRDRRTTGHASSSEAREWFRRAIRKALPGAFVRPDDRASEKGEK